MLQDVGIYRYHHPLENAAAYKDRLEAVNARIDDYVKTGRAVLASDMFTFDGSLAKGRKMTADDAVVAYELGWIEYRQFMSAINAELYQRGLTSLEQTEAADLLEAARELRPDVPTS